MTNPLLAPGGVKKAVKDLLTEQGFMASREEKALEAALVQVAKEKGTTPWVEAVTLRRAAGKKEKKFISGGKDLKNLEHKFYAREFAELGPRDFATQWIGSPAHALLKRAGLRGADNREGSLREALIGMQGAAEGGVNFLRKQFGLDRMEP